MCKETRKILLFLKNNWENVWWIQINIVPLQTQ